MDTARKKLFNKPVSTSLAKDSQQKPLCQRAEMYCFDFFILHTQCCFFLDLCPEILFWKEFHLCMYVVSDNRWQSLTGTTRKNCLGNILLNYFWLFLVLLINTLTSSLEKIFYETKITQSCFNTLNNENTVEIEIISSFMSTLKLSFYELSLATVQNTVEAMENLIESSKTRGFTLLKCILPLLFSEPLWCCTMFRNILPVLTKTCHFKGPKGRRGYMFYFYYMLHPWVLENLKVPLDIVSDSVPL